MKSNENSAMQMILHGGSARALAYEALERARAKDFVRAQMKLEEAETELEKGHDIQTRLLQKEAMGANQPATLLLAHAMDHLLTATAERGLIIEIIELMKKL